MDIWFPYSRQPVFISDLEGRRKWATYGPDSVSNHSLQMVKISCNFASNLCQKTGWDGNCLNILYNKSIHVLLLPLWLVDFWKQLSFTVYLGMWIHLQLYIVFHSSTKKDDIFNSHMDTLKAIEVPDGKLWMKRFSKWIL